MPTKFWRPPFSTRAQSFQERSQLLSGSMLPTSVEKTGDACEIVRGWKHADDFSSSGLNLFAIVYTARGRTWVQRLGTGIPCAYGIVMGTSRSKNSVEKRNSLLQPKRNNIKRRVRLITRKWSYLYISHWHSLTFFIKVDASCHQLGSNFHPRYGKVACPVLPSQLINVGTISLVSVELGWR